MQQISRIFALTFLFAVSFFMPIRSGAQISDSIGDINKDGLLDLVVTGTVYDPTISIYLNGPSGLVLANLYRFAWGEDPPHLIDANCDGNLDLILGGFLFLGNGSGGFAAPTAIACSATAVADVNEDGIPDLIEGNRSGGIKVCVGDGAGNFVVSDSHTINDYYSTPHIFGFLLADVNGDHHVDLLAREYTSIPKNSRLLVMVGDGAGRFSSPVASLLISSGGHTDLYLSEM